LKEAREELAGEGAEACATMLAAKQPMPTVDPWVDANFDDHKDFNENDDVPDIRDE
jgi:hypothetical protein